MWHENNCSCCFKQPEEKDVCTVQSISAYCALWWIRNTQMTSLSNYIESPTIEYCNVLSASLPANINLKLNNVFATEGTLVGWKHLMIMYILTKKLWHTYSDSVSGLHCRKNPTLLTLSLLEYLGIHMMRLERKVLLIEEKVMEILFFNFHCKSLV